MFLECYKFAQINSWNNLNPEQKKESTTCRYSTMWSTWSESIHRHQKTPINCSI